MVSQFELILYEALIVNRADAHSSSRENWISFR